MVKRSKIVHDASRQGIFEARSRYYQALRDGMTKEDAFAYANGGFMEVPEVTPPARPHRRPSAPPPETTLVQTVSEQVEVPAEQFKAQREADDLTRINGIGPGTVRRLAGMGVTSFSQIASWTEDDAARYDKQLSLRGRILREDWVRQAKTLQDST